MRGSGIISIVKVLTLDPMSAAALSFSYSWNQVLVILGTKGSYAEKLLYVTVWSHVEGVLQICLWGFQTSEDMVQSASLV